MISDLFAIIGIILIGAGTYQISLTVCLITLGVFFLIAAILRARNDVDEKSGK